MTYIIFAQRLSDQRRPGPVSDQHACQCLPPSTSLTHTSQRSGLGRRIDRTSMMVSQPLPCEAASQRAKPIILFMRSLLSEQRLCQLPRQYSTISVTILRGQAFPRYASYYSPYKSLIPRHRVNGGKIPVLLTSLWLSLQVAGVSLAHAALCAAPHPMRVRGRKRMIYVREAALRPLLSSLSALFLVLSSDLHIVDLVSPRVGRCRTCICMLYSPSINSSRPVTKV